MSNEKDRDVDRRDFGFDLFYIGGSVNEAAALGLILIVLGATCLFAIDRITGTGMGGVFG